MTKTEEIERKIREHFTQKCESIFENLHEQNDFYLGKYNIPKLVPEDIEKSKQNYVLRRNREN